MRCAFLASNSVVPPSDPPSVAPPSHATRTPPECVRVSLRERAGQRGWTPLHTASYYGKETDVQHLISSKANVSAKDNVSCSSMLIVID